MTRENRKYVAKRKYSTSFDVRTRLHARSDYPLSRSALKNFDAFTRSFGEILSITGVKIYVEQYDPTVDHSKVTDTVRDVEHIENPIYVSSETGLTSSDIAAKLSEVDTDDGMELYHGISTTDVTLNVYLEDGFFNVDASTPERYKFHAVTKDEYSKPQETPAVMQVRMGFRALKIASVHGFDKPVTNFYFKTQTDIWFEETQIGRINRARLHECFDRLDKELEILDYNYHDSSDMIGVGKNNVEEVFDYDGPSSDTLIEQHRLGWVDEQVRPTETRSMSGDTRVLDWTAPESVPRDELKTRVEVYVETHRSEFRDIERICLSHGTASLRGRVVDGTVHWDTGPNHQPGDSPGD